FSPRMCSIAAPTSQSYGRRFWPRRPSALFTSRSLCAASAASSLGAERTGESACDSTTLRSHQKPSDGMTSKKHFEKEIDPWMHGNIIRRSAISLSGLEEIGARTSQELGVLTGAC